MDDKIWDLLAICIKFVIVMCVGSTPGCSRSISGSNPGILPIQSLGIKSVLNNFFRKLRIQYTNTVPIMYYLQAPDLHSVGAESADAAGAGEAAGGAGRPEAVL